MSQMPLNELAGGLAADALEVACQMTLVEESDFGGDVRAWNAGEQKSLRGGHAHAAQISMGRLAES